MSDNNIEIIGGPHFIPSRETVEAFDEIDRQRTQASAKYNSPTRRWLRRAAHTVAAVTVLAGIGTAARMIADAGSSASFTSPNLRTDSSLLQGTDNHSPEIIIEPGKSGIGKDKFGGRIRISPPHKKIAE